MKKEIMYRQGDVLLKKVSNLPAGVEKVKSKVVAEGEGHHSHIVDEETEVLVANDRMFLSVSKVGRLEHVVAGTKTPAEHAAIDLPAGIYEVVNQREYNPFEKAIRRVRD